MTDAEIERRIVLNVLAGVRCGACEDRRKDPQYVAPVPGMWYRVSGVMWWVLCTKCNLWTYADFGGVVDFDKWVRRRTK